MNRQGAKDAKGRKREKREKRSWVTISSILFSLSFLGVLGALAVYLLPRELDGPRFADDRDLDFTGIVQLLLDGLGDVVADPHGIVVRRLRGVGDDAHLAAGLDGISLLDARETRRHRFQLL